MKRPHFPGVAALLHDYRAENEALRAERDQLRDALRCVADRDYAWRAYLEAVLRDG